MSVREEAVVPSSKRNLTAVEKKACTLANFSGQCVHKALRAFQRRVKFSKGSEVDAIHNESLWSDKSQCVHERIFVATWLWLSYKGEEELRLRLLRLIHELADRHLMLTYPIVRMIRNSNRNNTAAGEVDGDACDFDN